MLQDFKDASTAYNACLSQVIELKRARKDKEAIALLDSEEQKAAEGVAAQFRSTGRQVRDAHLASRVKSAPSPTTNPQ